MLKNIPAILSPELLKTLCEMGHSDRIIIADGNFPAVFGDKRRIKKKRAALVFGFMLKRRVYYACFSSGESQKRTESTFNKFLVFVSHVGVRSGSGKLFLRRKRGHSRI